MGQYHVDQRGPVIDPNFIIYVLKMLFDGYLADKEFVGNLRVFQPRKQETGHIDFSFAQMIRVNEMLGIHIHRRRRFLDANHKEQGVSRPRILLKCFGTGGIADVVESFDGAFPRDGHITRGASLQVCLNFPAVL